MTEKEFYKNIRTNILGEYIDNENNVAVIYVDYVESEKEIVAGTICNIGLITKVSVPFDDTCTVDQHLELLHELITEKGYRLNDSEYF